MFAHLCVFHSDCSMLAQAIFLGVHMHGVAAFGVDPIFYNTERMARFPEDFDWVLKEHVHEPHLYDPEPDRLAHAKSSAVDLARISLPRSGSDDDDLEAAVAASARASAKSGPTLGDDVVDETMRLIGEVTAAIDKSVHG